MNRKICLKCLDLKVLFGEKEEQYCRYCGRKMTDFHLECECSTEILPSFGYRVFPPWGRQLYNKHCLGCGKNITKLVKNYIKELKTQGRAEVSSGGS